MSRELAGVVLAAGAGARLRPLTEVLPKALCPVGGVPLVDLALRRLEPVTGPGPGRLAVNTHHGAEIVAAHLGDRVTVSREDPEALGTAGALGALRDWIAGRDVLVTNADLYLPGGLGRFAEGWDGERSRLLCVPATGRVDFPAPDPSAGIDHGSAQNGMVTTESDGSFDDGRPESPVGRPGPVRGLRYVGACLLPWRAVAGLAATPSGLYEVLWREQATRGALDLVTLAGTGAGEVAVDCGTPRDYLEANLHACAGRSAIGAGARVLGTVERCVVWDGAWVGPREHLVEVIRAGTATHPITVPAAPTCTGRVP